jgi:uncharacterized RDD family membrane protein YckC
MAIIFSCEQCGQRYQVEDSHAGKRIKCKKCEAVVAVPAGPPTAARPASRPPLQSFGQPPPPKSKPPLQTFGAPSAATPTFRAPEPPSEQFLGVDEEDGSPGDPYGLEEPEVPAAVPAFKPEGDDEENPYTPPRAKAKVKKSKKRAGPPAGLLARWSAGFLDGLVLLPVNFAANYFSSQAVDAKNAGVVILVGLAPLIIQTLYYAGMHSSASSATLGKKALHMRVVDLNGQPISFGKALAREIVKNLLILALCADVVVSFFTIIFTERKQALHDMIMGTVVVRD